MLPALRCHFALQIRKICLVMTPYSVNSPKTWSHKTLYLTMHFKAPPMAMPISTPNLMTKNVVLRSSRYEKRTVIQDMLLCSGKNTPFFKSLNKCGFLTLNNCADLSFNTFSTLKTMKIYAWFMSYTKIAPIIEL